MWPWTTKPVLSSTGIFVAIANNTLYGSKVSIFFFMPKLFSYCKYIKTFWLVICIAKDYIWTTLKEIFLNILTFLEPSDSRFSNSCISAKYCPILTNHTSMESLVIQQMMYKSPKLKKTDPYDWFCGPESLSLSLSHTHTHTHTYIHMLNKHF